MGNQGWSSSGGEAVSSTTRTTGVNTDCSDGDPFTRGSELGSTGAEGGAMGGRGDLFEPPGQGSTAN
jgi:hypothetical protein